jgi:hypothetical protein
VARSTIGRGLKDLADPGSPSGDIRRPGSGCPNLTRRDPALLENPRQLVETAVPEQAGMGDPMRPLSWVSKSHAAQVAVNGSGQYVIAASILLATDINYAGDVLLISDLLDNNNELIEPGHSGAVNGGTAALSANSSTITFTSAPGFTGVMSFRCNLTDRDEVERLGTDNIAEMSATVYLNTPAPKVGQLISNLRDDRM